MGKPKNITTLDGKHKEMLDAFNDEKEKILPALMSEKNAIYQQLETGQLNVDETLNLQDRLKDIKIKLRKIKEKEKTYLLNNSYYIFDYFENKKK